jgi:cell division protein FtsL
MNLLQWFNQHAISFTLILAYIPLLATVVTTIVSLVLVRATLRYTASSDRSLALAREQFEREWAPELHIKLERASSREAKVYATNLAKISVLMQMMQLRKLSMAVPSLRCFLNEPLVGGTTWSEDLGKRFFACTGEDYEGQLAVSITFYAAGRMYRTDWFRFQVQVRNNQLLRLDPVNISARRVRVLQSPKGSHSIQSDLVRDVVMDVPQKSDKEMATSAIASEEQ